VVRWEDSHVATDPIPKTLLTLAFWAAVGAALLAGCGGGDPPTERDTTTRIQEEAPSAPARKETEAAPQRSVDAKGEASGKEAAASPSASSNAHKEAKNRAAAAPDRREEPVDEGGSSGGSSAPVEGTAGEAPEEPAASDGLAPPGSAAAEQASAK